MRLSALLLALVALPAEAAPDLRIQCSGFTGNRLDYHDSQMLDQKGRRKLASDTDAMGGLEMTVVFDLAARTAAVSTRGNRNAAPYTNNFTIIATSPYLTAAGVDSGDGTTRHMLSYRPDLGRMVWSMQADQIFGMDRVAVAKQFMGSCRPSVQK